MFSYTPRRLNAFLFLARRRHKMDDAQALSIAFMGAHGDQKAVKKTIAEWEKGE